MAEGSRTNDEPWCRRWGGNRIIDIKKNKLAGRRTNEEPEDRHWKGGKDIDVKEHMVAPTQAGETGARGPRPDPAETTRHE